jgi:D-sedoheptulose 7-phosphate isomerase
MAPHLAEELWREVLGHSESIFRATWPSADAALAREVELHARAGDVLVAVDSGDGEGDGVAEALETATRLGVETLAVTGQAPNALARAADEAVSVPAASRATLAELQLAAAHLLCGAVQREIALSPSELAEVRS